MGEGLDQGRTDWKRVDALRDADVATAIAEDPDSASPHARSSSGRFRS